MFTPAIPGALIPGEDDRPEEIPIPITLVFPPVFGSDDGDDLDDDDEDLDEDEADDAVTRLAEDAEDAKKASAARRKPSPPGPNGKYVPPTEEEWRKVQAALSRANENQRTRRQAALERAKAEGLSEGEAKARADAEEAARSTYEPKLIMSEARQALMEAGCKDPRRLAKLIDRSTITVVDGRDGQMELVGLEDQVNRLAEDWPELFKNTADQDEAPPPKPRGKNLDAADRTTRGSSRQAKTSTEKALDRLRGF